MSTPDLSEFLSAQTTPGPSGCGVATVLEALDDDRRASFKAALDAPHIQHSAIARVLRSWGFDKPTDFTIGRHRRGTCSCG